MRIRSSARTYELYAKIHSGAAASYVASFRGKETEQPGIYSVKIPLQVNGLRLFQMFQACWRICLECEDINIRETSDSGQAGPRRRLILHGTLQQHTL